MLLQCDVFTPLVQGFGLPSYLAPPPCDREYHACTEYESEGRCIRRDEGAAIEGRPADDAEVIFQAI